MNPYLLLAALIAVGALTGGAYYQGRQDGANGELATQAREDSAIAKGAAAAASAAAVAISGIDVKNVTIRQTLEKEVHENTVYRDCRSGPLAVGMLNSTPGVGPAAAASSGSQLPASGADR
jgi:hypothetical protein